MPRVTLACWAPVLLAVLIASLAPSALADTKTVEIRDDGALLVGEPTDGPNVHTNLAGASSHYRVGTEVTYTFEVASGMNRLEIDLAYNEGPGLARGPCVHLTDLDVYVTGPDGFRIVRDGCDPGRVTLLEDNVPTGSYEVRVDAAQGTTACLPDADHSCELPDPEYSFEATVWDLRG